MTKTRRSAACYGKPDRIRVSASTARLDPLVNAAELETRRTNWQPDAPHYLRGHAKLLTDHVLQADRGADLNVFLGKHTSPVTRESY